MKANLDTIVEESNKQDERIEVLELWYHQSPVWKDSTGKVLGGYDGNDAYLFIKVSQSAEVSRYNLSLDANDTVSCISNRLMWYTEANCQGDVVMGREVFNGVQWAEPGRNGKIHIRGAARTDLTQLQSYSRVVGGCSAVCTNDSNGLNGWYEAIPTDIPNDLGATPPFQLSWPD
jgi:hypothetical protein